MIFWIKRLCSIINRDINFDQVNNSMEIVIIYKNQLFNKEENSYAYL